MNRFQILVALVFRHFCSFTFRWCNQSHSLIATHQKKNENEKGEMTLFTIHFPRWKKNYDNPICNISFPMKFFSTRPLEQSPLQKSIIYPNIFMNIVLAFNLYRNFNHVDQTTPCVFVDFTEPQQRHWCCC